MFNNYHKFYLSLVLLWAAIKSSCRDDLQIARNPDGVLPPPSSCPFSIFSQFHIFLSWFLFPTGYIYKSDESRWDSSPLFSINFNPTMPVSVLCSRLNPYFLLPFICIAGFTNYRIPWERCISWLTEPLIQTHLEFSLTLYLLSAKQLQHQKIVNIVDKWASVHPIQRALLPRRCIWTKRNSHPKRSTPPEQTKFPSKKLRSWWETPPTKKNPWTDGRSGGWWSFGKTSLMPKTPHYSIHIKHIKGERGFCVPFSSYEFHSDFYMKFSTTFFSDMNFILPPSGPCLSLHLSKCCLMLTHLSILHTANKFLFPCHHHFGRFPFVE